jgi:hypothetical protein
MALTVPWNGRSAVLKPVLLAGSHGWFCLPKPRRCSVTPASLAFG